MEQKDAGLMNEKLDYIDIDFDTENIILKPSVELIPDEYEHVDNKAALVHVFRGEYKHDAINTERFLRSMNNIGYEVPFENVHFIRKRDQVLKDLDEIAGNTEGKSCLIILFLDVYKEGDNLILHEEPNAFLTTKDVWINFTGFRCPNLRDKPKIFIFQATKFLIRVQHDAVGVGISNSRFYQVPAEADMLIVYKRVEDDDLKQKFIQDFCNNIDSNGQRDDIVTLITQTDHPNSIKTLVISTLTKKFYFTPSLVRGHHLDLHQNNIGISKALTDLHVKVGNVLVKSADGREDKVSVKRVSSLRASNKSSTVADSAKTTRPSPGQVKVKKAASVTATRPPWKF